MRVVVGFRVEIAFDAPSWGKAKVVDKDLSLQFVGFRNETVKLTTIVSWSPTGVGFAWHNSAFTFQEGCQTTEGDWGVNQQVF
jgi:hypothetical protein